MPMESDNAKEQEMKFKARLALSGIVLEARTRLGDEAHTQAMRIFKGEEAKPKKLKKATLDEAIRKWKMHKLDDADGILAEVKAQAEAAAAEANASASSGEANHGHSHSHGECCSGPSSHSNSQHQSSPKIEEIIEEQEKLSAAPLESAAKPAASAGSGGLGLDEDEQDAKDAPLPPAAALAGLGDLGDIAPPAPPAGQLLSSQMKEDMRRAAEKAAVPRPATVGSWFVDPDDDDEDDAPASVPVQQVPAKKTPTCWCFAGLGKSR